MVAERARCPHRPVRPRAESRRAGRARARGHALIVGAGPVGLELAGEIRTAFPGVRVTIVDAAADILDGPYAPALRTELRAQLDALGVELLLDSPLAALPETAPGRLEPFTVHTAAGGGVSADVWFRCFGVTPVSDYLGDGLAAARTPDGFIEVTPELRVAGHDRVFALGDVSTADRKMAGFARFQAEVVVDNIRALHAGGGELTAYERFPAAIAVPLGPEGGAGQFPGQEGIVGAGDRRRGQGPRDDGRRSGRDPRSRPGAYVVLISPPSMT